MKKIILFSLICYQFCAANQAAVTYDFSHGRFGDNLVAYLHAKWLSFKYQIPLSYKPFEYSNQLVLHQQERKHNKRERVTLSCNNVHIDIFRNCLYTVPFFGESPWERKLPCNSSMIYFEVDWNNRAFLAEIRRLISPINQSLLKFPLPKDRISVAIHIRRGGGHFHDLGSFLYESGKKEEGVHYIDVCNPVRFLPISFYVEQLKHISQIFDDVPLYVFVFTDDPNPGALVGQFKKQLEGYPNIEFDYRKQGNFHDAHVLEDFFAMTKFDCLIRPQSHYSFVAGKLGRPLIEIAPLEFHWEGDRVIFDKVEIIDRRGESRD